MKQVSARTSIDGEKFDLDGPKIYTETAGPFKRGLAYIEARDRKILRQAKGDFREYDETNTVNQG